MPSILFGAWQKVKMPNIFPRIVAIVHEIGPRERRAKSSFRKFNWKFENAEQQRVWERARVREKASRICRAKRAFSCSLSLSLSLAGLLALSACLTNVRIRNYNCGILFKTCDEYTWPTPTPGSASPLPQCTHLPTHTQTHTHRRTRTGRFQPRTWIGLNWKCLSFPPQLLGCLCIDFRRISVSVIEFPLSTVDWHCSIALDNHNVGSLHILPEFTIWPFASKIRTVWPSSAAAAWLLFALTDSSQTLNVFWIFKSTSVHPSNCLSVCHVGQ